MSKTHVVMHLVVDWDFATSELSNLLEDELKKLDEVKVLFADCVLVIKDKDDK